MRDPIVDLDVRINWKLDGDRVTSPSGQMVARMKSGVLLLYDKKTGSSWPFTVSDFIQLANKQGVDSPQNR